MQPKSIRSAPRPGGCNGAGEFFDPDGIKLGLVAKDATGDEAQALIESGAAVVAEVCGCGGSYGDCTPEWVTRDQLRDLRRGLAPGSRVLPLKGRSGLRGQRAPGLTAVRKPPLADLVEVPIVGSAAQTPQPRRSSQRC